MIRGADDKVTNFLILVVASFLVLTFHFGSLQILFSGVLAGGVILIRHNYFHFRYDLVWVLFVLYFIYGVVATCLNGQFDRAIFYYALSLVSFFVGTLLPAKNDNYVFILIMFVLSVLTFLMFFQIEPGVFDVSVEYLVSRSRADSYILHDSDMRIGSTVIAPMLTVCALCSVHVALNAKHFGLRGLAYVFMFYSVGLQIFSGSRTGIVAVVVVVAVVGLLSLGKLSIANLFKASLVFFVITLFVSSVVLLSVENSSDSYYRFSRITEVKADESLLIRFRLWEDAVSLIDRNILGYGPTYFLERNSYSTHNEFLGVAVALGIPGLALWLSAYGALLGRLIYRRAEYGKSYPLFFGYFLVLLFSSLTENFSLSGAFFIAPIFYLFAGRITNVWGQYNRRN